MKSNSNSLVRDAIAAAICYPIYPLVGYATAADPRVTFVYLCFIVHSVYLALFYRQYNCFIAFVILGGAVVFFAAPYIGASSASSLALSPILFLSIYKVMAAVPFLRIKS